MCRPASPSDARRHSTIPSPTAMKNTAIVILSLALTATLASHHRSASSAGAGHTIPVTTPVASSAKAPSPSPRVETPRPEKGAALLTSTPMIEAETLAPLPTPVATTAAATPTSATPSLADTIAKVMPSVVSIVTNERSASPHPAAWNGRGSGRRFYDPDEEEENEYDEDSRGGLGQGLGSGVIFTADGYILTNYHVVREASTIEVVTHNPEKSHRARLVGGDAESDVAVLKIDATGLPAATMGASQALRVGDTVLAIGNPFGLTQTVTSGIVSALGRSNLHITSFEDFIQTDASINPGNSGGALMDTAGHVVGINTAIFSRTGGNVGIGFAIPINMATAFARQIMDEGRVRRGFLGVSVEDGGDAGAQVREVTVGSPAATAGIQEGDTILKINGQPVQSGASLRNSIAQVTPGSSVTLHIRRDGQEKDVTATIQERPASSPRDNRRGTERDEEPRTERRKNYPSWR